MPQECSVVSRRTWVVPTHLLKILSEKPNWENGLNHINRDVTALKRMKTSQDYSPAEQPTPQKSCGRAAAPDSCLVWGSTTTPPGAWPKAAALEAQRPLWRQQAAGPGKRPAAEVRATLASCSPTAGAAKAPFPQAAPSWLLGTAVCCLTATVPGHNAEHRPSGSSKNKNILWLLWIAQLPRFP